MMRVFIGITAPDALKRALDTTKHHMIESDPRLGDQRWVDTDNLHVTVRFLGDVAEGTARALISALGPTIGLHDAFMLPVGELEVRPRGRSGGMLWLSLEDPDDRFMRLCQSVDSVCEHVVPWSKRDHPATPHITIARFRRPLRMRTPLDQRLQADLPGSMSVPRVTVFKSTLTRQGPTYQDLATLELGSD